MGDNCSVWFQTVIRGDVNSIEIGNKVNIQDGTVVHCTYKNSTKIGNNVSIGHNSIVHGCTINDNVLIGMGSILMDGVVIESNSIVKASRISSVRRYYCESGTICRYTIKKVKDLDEEKD